MKKLLTLILVLCISLIAKCENPVDELLARIDYSAVKKFSFSLTDQMSEKDFFAIDSKRGKIVIEGNNWISVAAGLNWYLKYYAGVNITWSNPRERLLNLPKPKTREVRSTDELVRYYLNYCTSSYSMAFWGTKRWQQEIDFMALHGINTPLLTVGMPSVWRNVMLRLGYSPEQVNDFVAGPAHQAWWLMGNLQGWGGPNPDSYYRNQEELAKFIMAQYKTWGIDPVLVGYGGMLPSFAPKDSSTLGATLIKREQGKWCEFQRPALLEPTSKQFAQVADIYYDELTKFYGVAKYYSADPFHEGGSTKDIDIAETGEQIYSAMQRASQNSTWVMQSWQKNPLPRLIEGLPQGGIMVLDLWSESRPQWGDLGSMWYRKGGFMGHQWVFSMLLNFGGNTGLFGKMEYLLDGYYKAKASPYSLSLVGVGATMESIGNNEMMYELLFELPWRKDKPKIEEWIGSWTKVRYGRTTPESIEAWEILSQTVYNPPYESTQEGSSESVFCARPALEASSASSWGSSGLYYESEDLLRALELMVSVSERYRGCDNFEYDIIDVARQCLANYGLELLPQIELAFDKGYRDMFAQYSDKFLEAMLLEDDLLNSHSSFMVGPWIESAMQMGTNPAERDWYRWNARTLITTWGPRGAANGGGLRDYAHREWGGLVKDFYYPRWKQFFDYIKTNEQLPLNFDYYDMEAAWTANTNPYPINPTKDVVDEALRVYMFLKANSKDGEDKKGNDEEDNAKENIDKKE